MDPKIKALIEIEDHSIELHGDSPLLDALDDVCQLILEKENLAEFPEDYPEIHLSEPERAIAQAWSAWGLALNGGATEAISCALPEETADAFIKLDAPDISKDLIELARCLEEFEVR